MSDSHQPPFATEEDCKLMLIEVAQSFAWIRGDEIFFPGFFLDCKCEGRYIRIKLKVHDLLNPISLMIMARFVSRVITASGLEGWSDEVRVQNDFQGFADPNAGIEYHKSTATGVDIISLDADSFLVTVTWK